MSKLKNLKLIVSLVVIMCLFTFSAAIGEGGWDADDTDSGSSGGAEPKTDTTQTIDDGESADSVAGASWLDNLVFTTSLYFFNLVYGD